MSLLNLTKSARALEEIILEHAEANDGSTDGMEDMIEAWSRETDEPLEAKLESIARLLREWESIAKLQREEARRLADAAKSNDSRAERLREWTKFCLESQGITKYQAGPYKFAIQKNGGVAPMDLIIDDVEQWPIDFLITKTTIDTSKARDFLAAGNHLEGLAVMRNRGTSLRIK